MPRSVGTWRRPGWAAAPLPGCRCARDTEADGTVRAVSEVTDAASASVGCGMQNPENSASREKRRTWLSSSTHSPPDFRTRKIRTERKCSERACQSARISWEGCGRQGDKPCCHFSLLAGLGWRAAIPASLVHRLEYGDSTIAEHRERLFRTAAHAHSPYQGNELSSGGVHGGAIQPPGQRRSR